MRNTVRACRSHPRAQNGAVSTSALAYAVVLPMLPSLAAQVSSTPAAPLTGRLMAAYSIALVLTAPFWARAGQWQPAPHARLPAGVRRTGAVAWATSCSIAEWHAGAARNHGW